jgi:hypothetical protein
LVAVGILGVALFELLINRPRVSESSGSTGSDARGSAASRSAHAGPVRDRFHDPTARGRLWAYSDRVRDEVQRRWTQFVELASTTLDIEEGGTLKSGITDEDVIHYENIRNECYQVAFSDEDHFAALFDLLSSFDLGLEPNAQATSIRWLVQELLQEGSGGNMVWWKDLSKIRRLIAIYAEADREQDRYILCRTFSHFGKNVDRQDVEDVLDLIRNETSERAIRGDALLGWHYSTVPAIKQFLMNSYLVENVQGADLGRFWIAFGFYNSGGDLSGNLTDDPDFIDMLSKGLRSQDPRLRQMTLLLLPSGGEGQTAAGPALFNMYADLLRTGPTGADQSSVAWKLAQYDGPDLPAALPALIKDLEISYNVKQSLIRSIGWAMSDPTDRDAMRDRLTELTQDTAVPETLRWQIYGALLKHLGTYTTAWGEQRVSSAAFEVLDRAMGDPSKAVRQAAEQWFDLTMTTGWFDLNFPFQVPLHSQE